MPYSLPAAGTELTRLNHAEPVVTLLNNTEAAASNAQKRADDAHALATSKYTLPTGGIPKTSLSNDLQLVLNNALVFAKTSTARPAGEQPTLWADPTADPGANARAGELWVGDVV